MTSRAATRLRTEFATMVVVVLLLAAFAVAVLLVGALVVHGLETKLILQTVASATALAGLRSLLWRLDLRAARTI